MRQNGYSVCPARPTSRARACQPDRSVSKGPAIGQSVCGPYRRALARSGRRSRPTMARRLVANVFGDIASDRSASRGSTRPPHVHRRRVRLLTPWVGWRSSDSHTSGVALPVPCPRR